LQQEVQIENTYEENTNTSTGKSGKIKANPGTNFKKVPLKIDIETLDLLLAYCYEMDSPFITRTALMNFQTYIEMINMNRYRNNQSLKARIDFIKLLLEGRLVLGFDNKKLLVNFALDKSEYRELVKEEILPELYKIKLNTRAVQYLNSYVVDRLIHGFMYSYQEEIFRIFADLESDNFKSVKDIVTEFKALITNLLHDIRNAENYSEDNLTLDLSEGTFESIVTQIVKKLKDPNNKLVTNIQALNIMLNGGFEAARAYLFLGITGVGKSVLLLNLLVALKQCNVVVTKDPNKIPALVLVTQENTLEETVERMFNMEVTGNNIRDYTPSEVVKLLRTKGQFILTDKNNIDIVIKYFDDKEISTLDFYSIISDVEDTGREVIAFLHDYIERVRSSRNHSEIRLEIAEVANDYSVLAKRLRIPVIGLGQLNRKAADIIDTSLESNKFDIVRFLGKGTISESFGMLKNIDSATVINREMDSEGNEYMAFADMKQRSGRKRKNTKFSKHFFHPFDPSNGIKLLDDKDLDEPLSKETLDDVEAQMDIIKRNSKKKEVKELNVKKNKESDIEIIDNEVIKDFKFLEEVIKNRKAQKERRIKDETVEDRFDKVFTSYNDDAYARNENGYIKISLK
jgi:replicative DNA helicase